MRRWKFCLRPFWIFSHIFVAVSVCLFAVLSVWQFDRLDEKRSTNAQISEQMANRPITIDQLESSTDLEYSPISDTLELVDDDFIRIVNRTQKGVTGEHVIALAQTKSQLAVFINRGFVASNSPVSDLAGDEIQVKGIALKTIEREYLGIEDVGSSTQAPRLDISKLAERILPPSETLQYWIQQTEVEQAQNAPSPLEPPALSEGNHQSYAFQWLIFALLTVVFYAALLVRKSRGTELEPA